MTREQKIAKAVELRAEGRGLREIAEEFGVTTGCIFKWVNPDRAKAYGRRDSARPERRVAKRAWEKNHRATCSECGGSMGVGSALSSGERNTARTASDVCAECNSRRRAERCVEMMRLRHEGLLTIEIGQRLGVPAATVATEMTRLRALGFDIPPSPYKNHRLKAKQAVHREVEILARTLVSQGVELPRPLEVAA